MPDRKFARDMESWKRLGRRWSAILSVLLCGNFCLIVLAATGFGGATPNSGVENSLVAAGEPCPEAVVSSEASVDPASAAEQPAEVAEVAATVVPATDTTQAPRTESLADLESPSKAVPTLENPQTSVEKHEQAATEPAKITEVDTTPQVKDESNSELLAESGIVIVNPTTTGGTVHFVVEGKIYSLPAGTYRQFAGKTPQRVIFHKGDDEADAQHDLETGLFAFAVGSVGWELAPVDSENSQKVLRGCHLATE